ncbi:MAG: hypothetical protein PHT88_04180 [Candidatus Moranbacteria bacterium]|nr:hypothetical protein [Candidatus Moranbacteria bacterium]
MFPPELLCSLLDEEETCPSNWKLSTRVFLGSVLDGAVLFMQTYFSATIQLPPATTFATCIVELSRMYALACAAVAATANDDPMFEWMPFEQ